MTKHQPICRRPATDTAPDPFPAGIIRSTAEEKAIFAGVVAGDAALARLGSSGVLLLFEDARHPVKSDPRLEVLRTYAELKRALLKQGQDLPASSLAAAGYSAAEIMHFNSIIAAAPSSNVQRSGTGIHPTQTEND